MLLAPDVTLNIPSGWAISAWGASSSVGRVRDCNEDRYGHAGTMFVVADGMGGLRGGGEAAAEAVDETLRLGSLIGPDAPLGAWSAMVRSISEDLRRSTRRRGFDKAGTTLTTVSVEPDRIVAAHVGDSRLYELTNGDLRQHTVDHSLRNELLSLGKDLDGAVRQGMRLDALVSFVGLRGRDLRVDVFSWMPTAGSRLLLSTDGVHGCLTAGEIAQTVGGFPADEAARRLTNRAELSSGRDNATAVVVEL